MTTTNQNAAGGGLFSKLVVLLLLAAAVGLYLRIVVVEGKAHYGAPAVQASVRVLEGNERLPAGDTLPPRELPADQMALIKRVFAPELTR